MMERSPGEGPKGRGPDKGPGEGIEGPRLKELERMEGRNTNERD